MPHKFKYILGLLAAAALRLSAPVYADGYTVTIPAEVNVDTTTRTGTLTVTAETTGKQTVTVGITSQNEYNLVCGSYKLGYTIDESAENRTLTYTNNSETTETQTDSTKLTVALNSDATPQVSGTYQDILTFDISSTYAATDENPIHSVTFDANGGTTDITEKKLTAGATLGIMPTPTRPGYTFEGWFDEATSGNKVDASTTMGSADRTLYAHWQAKSYTVLIYHWAFGFTNNEGNNTTNNGTAFNFAATSFQMDCDEEYDFKKELTETGKVTTAVPAPNGFKLESMGSRSLVQNDNTWYVWTFSDSSHNSWLQHFKMYPNPPNNQVYVEYSYYPIDYTITYNLDGGTNDSENPSTYNVLYGVTLKAPTREGYTFDGWFDDKGNEVTGINEEFSNNYKGASTDETKQKFYDDMKSRKTGDITLTAHWTPHTLTIRYHNDGATSIHWEDRDDNVKDVEVSIFQKETYGTKFSNTVSGLYDVWRWKKTGYTAKGNAWKKGPDGTEEYDDHKGFTNAEDCAEYLGVLEEFKKGDVVVDLYPIWIAYKYTIKYDSNEGEGTINSQSCTYDVEVTLPEDGFTRDGYTLAGWSTDKEGTEETTYELGGTVKNLTATSNGTVTLYAQWTPIEQTADDELTDEETDDKNTTDPDTTEDSTETDETTLDTYPAPAQEMPVVVSAVDLLPPATPETGERE